MYSGKPMSILAYNVVFTDFAVNKVRDILAKEDGVNILFRIKVEGGGCSGFQYKFDVDRYSHNVVGSDNEDDEDDEDEDDEDDEVDLEDDGDFFDAKESEECIVRDADDIAIAIIDTLSLNYLKGCTIDYVEDLTKSSFVVHNPKAVGRCGCGNSFAV